MSLPASVTPQDAALFNKFSQLCIDTISGILMGHGYPDQYIAGIPPITLGGKLVGRARTMRYLPIRTDLAEQAKALYPFGLTHTAVEDTEPGDVLVVDSGGCVGAGFIGDVIVSRFIVRGGAGIVCDGAIRDYSILRGMGIPIFTKGVHAAVSQRRIVGIGYQIPVSCGGVAVIPGDIIFGDDEGCVVIPAHLAEQVADKGLSVEHREYFLRKVLEEGVRPIHEVYPPNADVLKAYEDYKSQGF